MQPRKAAKGIQSIEVGFRVLTAIQQLGGEASLTRIAERAELSASAAHNYLTSFLRTGMVRSNARGSYQLGPSLAALGMSAFRSVDHFDLVREHAVDLSEQTGLGTAILGWSPQGPIILFNKAQVRGQVFALRNGLVSLTGTGGGQIFIAHKPLEETLAVALNAAGPATTHQDAEAWRQTLKGIRQAVQKQGYAAVTLDALPGYSAISVPIVDENGEVNLALTLTAPSERIDMSAKSPQIDRLRKTAAHVSWLIGAPGEPVSGD